jgi:hypothetical protein
MTPLLYSKSPVISYYPERARLGFLGRFLPDSPGSNPH